jgi:hypothetical protein
MAGNDAAKILKKWNLFLELERFIRKTVNSSSVPPKKREDLFLKVVKSDRLIVWFVKQNYWNLVHQQPTFLLQARLNPEAKNPPNGPNKLEKRLIRNPWTKNPQYEKEINPKSWK